MEEIRAYANRRTVLEVSGAAMAVSALAGCSGGTRAADDPSSNDEADSTSGSTERLDGWMEDVGNYDGVTDLTGRQTVTVITGAQGNGGPFAFDPAAIRISTDTTIVWEWTGRGSPHNVVDESGNFESEMLSDEGATFEHSFRESGEYNYSCVPHESIRMKGVVVVD